MALFHRRRGHDGENYGPHEIEQAVKVADFPTTRDALAERFGAKAVQIEHGHAVDLRAILSCIPEERFESPSDVREAAAREWDRIRALRPYTGYPGEERWSDVVPEPEAQQHIVEDILGLSGDQNRIK